MLNLKSITSALTGRTETSKANENLKVLSPEVFRRKQMYDTVMNTVQYVGGKQFCYIPLELLEIDNRYQRLDSIDINKVYELVRNFDINQMEPIQVAAHPETYTFVVVNGAHRMLCQSIRKETGIEAMLITGLSEDPDKRLIQESTIFVDQGLHDDRVKPFQAHNGNVLRGVKKYVVLDECIKDRKLVLHSRLMKESENKNKDEYAVLTGYTAALRTANMSKGKEILSNVLNIIERSGWHMAANGYSDKVITTLSSILNLHDNSDAVVNAIIEYFTLMEPQEFFSRAYAAFPARKPKERLCMELELAISKIMGFAPLYTGGDMRKVSNANNLHKRTA